MSRFAGKADSRIVSVPGGRVLHAAREGQLVLHFLRDRIKISKISYFPAVSQLLRTGARSIAIMAPLIPVFALAHGSIRALFSWLDANAARNTASARITKVVPCGIKPADLKQIGGHAVKVGASEAPFAAGPSEAFSKPFCWALF
jgi:hypothetical protein